MTERQNTDYGDELKNIIILFNILNNNTDCNECV